VGEITKIRKGVRQGDTLSQTLALLAEIFRRVNENIGINIYNGEQTTEMKQNLNSSEYNIIEMIEDLMTVIVRMLSCFTG